MLWWTTKKFKYLIDFSKIHFNIFIMLDRPGHVSREGLVSLWDGNPGGEGGGAASLLKLGAAPPCLHSARLGEPKLKCDSPGVSGMWAQVWALTSSECDEMRAICIYQRRCFDKNLLRLRWKWSYHIKFLISNITSSQEWALLGNDFHLVSPSLLPDHNWKQIVPHLNSIQIIFQTRLAVDKGQACVFGINSCS